MIDYHEKLAEAEEELKNARIQLQKTANLVSFFEGQVAVCKTAIEKDSQGDKAIDEKIGIHPNDNYVTITEKIIENRISNGSPTTPKDIVQEAEIHGIASNYAYAILSRLKGKGVLQKIGKNYEIAKENNIKVEQIEKPEKKDVLVCKGKDALAEGVYAEGCLIVFAGSTANLKETPATASYIIKHRRELIEEGTLVPDGNVYRFANDYTFPTPTRAANIVLGRNAAGPDEWKYKDGRTLNQVQR